jgi:hypothetical protein
MLSEKVFSVSYGASKLPPVDWRSPTCGGSAVNGTEFCILDEETNKVDCKCINPPKAFNATTHFILAQAIFNGKYHLTRECAQWEMLAQNLFSIGAFKKYSFVLGKTLKIRFDDQVKIIRKKHDLPEIIDGVSTSQGFETHPDITPYEALIIKMIEDMDQQITKKLKEKTAETAKKNTMLSHEVNLGMVVKPRIVKPKNVPDVFNEEGVLVENGMSDTDLSPITTDVTLDTVEIHTRLEKGYVTNKQMI